MFCLYVIVCFFKLRKKQFVIDISEENEQFDDDDKLFQTFLSSIHREFGIEWSVEVQKETLDDDHIDDDDDDDNDDSSEHDADDDDDDENDFDDEDDDENQDEDEDDDDDYEFQNLGVLIKAKPIDSKMKK